MPDNYTTKKFRISGMVCSGCENRIEKRIMELAGVPNENDVEIGNICFRRQNTFLITNIGVESFRNQQYSEQRVAMIRTVFGTSARAQFIHKLLTRWRKYRKVGL